MLYRSHIFYAQQIKPFYSFQHTQDCVLPIVEYFYITLGKEVVKDALCNILITVKRALENIVEKMHNHWKATLTWSSQLLLIWRTEEIGDGVPSQQRYTLHGNWKNHLGSTVQYEWLHFKLLCTQQWPKYLTEAVECYQPYHADGKVEKEIIKASISRVAF